MSSPLRVELELDDGSFTARMIHAGETVDQFVQNVGRGVSGVSRMGDEVESLGERLKTLTFGFWVAREAIHDLESITTGWIGEIVKVNAEVERMTSTMKALSTAKDPLAEATRYISDLREEAKQAPFELQTMHQSFLRLQASGLDAKTSIAALTDAVAAFGGTDENLQRASLAFQEMAGKGVVQMKELRNQLGMSIPNAIPMLARSLGVSYSELMEDIHSGTVDAKSAITALDAEIERTFGGQAQQMMKTFNGEIASMKVRLQDIAITKIGGGFDANSGFFGELKRDLADMNTFLDGPGAKGIGEDIGNGLTYALQTLRLVVEEVVSFKDELGTAAEVFMVGIGARAIWSTLEFGIGKVQSLRQELTLLGLAGRTAGEAIEMNNMAAAIGRLGLVGGNGATLGMTRLQAATGNAAQVFGLLSTGISTALPWFTLLLPILAAGAEHFGIFHDKAEEAFESLDRFGARTAEAAKKGDDYIESLERQLKALKDFQGAAGTDMVAPGPDDAEIAAAQKKLDDARARLAGIKDQASNDESKDFAAKQMAAYNDTRTAIQRDYNANAVKLSQDFDAQQKALNKAHQDAGALGDQYRADKHALDLKEYSEELEAIQKLISANEDLAAANAGSQTGLNARAAVSSLQAEYMRVISARDAAQTSGVTINPKGLDTEKLLEKGQESLDKLRAKLQGFVSGIQDGADPAVVELDGLLSGLKLGDPAIERVQELRKELVDTKGMADALNDALKGQDKFDHDLDTVEEQNQERIFKAKYGQLSEIDQLNIKVQQGLYKGVGPNRSALEQMLEHARETLVDVNGKAGQLGDTLEQKTFGSTTQTAIKTFADLMQQAADNAARMSQSLGGLDFGAAMEKGRDALANYGLFSGGGGSFMDKLINRESGGSNTAKNPNSSAQGLGQFTDGTWRAFLTSVHPDLPQDAASIRSQREDGGMSREAIQWYAQQNAHDLVRGGFDPTDANLYMSHLLGSGGAKQVLSADPSEKLAEISGTLARAVAQNPFLNGQTAGSLQEQLNKQFGTGYSVPGVMPSLRGNVAGPYVPGSVPDGLTPDQESKDQRAINSEAEAKREEAAAKLRDKLSELNDKLGVVNLRVDDSKGKNSADMMTAILSGKLGPSKDPKDPQNAQLLDVAKKLDDAIKNLDDSKKARTRADDAIAQLGKDKNAAGVERQDIFTRANDPNAVGRSAELVRKQQQDSQNLKDIGDSYGTGSQQYLDAQKQASDNEATLRNNEIAKNLEGLRQKTAALRDSLMDQEDAKQDAFNREKKRIDDELAHFTGSEEEKKKLAKDAADYIQAANQKLGMSGPLSQEMKGWGDMMGNMERGVTSWVSSSTDALSTLITTGKANWQSLSQQITKDMVNMGLHYGMSSLFSGVTGKGAAGGASKLGASMPHFATGGQIAGPGTGTSDDVMARVSNGEFVMNADATRKNLGLLQALNSGRLPAFATGGQIDTSALPSAASGANFAPDMIDSAMNGKAPGTTHNWNTKVELHAQGGTTAQNQDLARRASAEMEAAVRRVALNEITRQQRPGGALYN